MELNEYLLLFSNKGKSEIQVKFKDFEGTIANQSMEPGEIVQLISPDNSGFLTTMTFDERPFKIYKYEIDPIKNKLTIRARKR